VPRSPENCNVDPIWERWLTDHGRDLPPARQRIGDTQGPPLHDQLSSLVSAPMTPADTLDMTAIDNYDSLAV
jgi:hypothetical protein